MTTTPLRAARWGSTDGADVVDVSAMEGAKGDIAFCMGKDTSGNLTAATKAFNQEFPDVTAELIEFSTSADEQRAQFVQRQEAESGECDVFWADVIWTAEFASQKWTYDMTPYMEQEARRYFESGRATYMRNWPYAYELGNAKGSKIRGKFDVAPLPSFEGGGKAGILGGHNMVISIFSENPGAALKFIDFVTSRETSEITAACEYPFADQLRDAVGQAKSRPVSPVYPQISQAIYENVSAALEGSVTPAEALETF